MLSLTITMSPKTGKKKDYDDDSEMINALLLKLVTKYTEIIEQNSALVADVNQLKADNRALTGKYAEPT